MIGRITKDIELRTTQSGISTCSFNVAVDRPKSKEGTRTSDFPTVVVWRQTAELCAKYLHKGSKVGVEGSIQTRSYESRDGKKNFVTEVVADRVEFLDPKSEYSYQQPAQSQFVEVDDDDVPF